MFGYTAEQMNEALNGASGFYALNWANKHIEDEEKRAKFTFLLARSGFPHVQVDFNKLLAELEG
jgi:hypothetical protein